MPGVVFQAKDPLTASGTRKNFGVSSTQGDLSRLGRSYLDCGYYQEIYFPEHRVRYIAVNDGYDSQNRPALDVTPFRNIMNEMYATDISVKVRSALRARFQSGKYRGTTPPYGFLKDPADHSRLIIDEQAAPVVRMIYDMALKGWGVRRIRNELNKRHILRPSAYSVVRGDTLFAGRQAGDEKACRWSENGVRMILRNPVYAGNLCGYKRVSVGVKSKKRLCRPPEEWEIVRGTHEGIVSQQVFDQVQEIMNGHRAKASEDKADNLFAGLLHCGDCGQVLVYSCAHRGRRENEIENRFYACNNYMQYGREACTMHKIEAVDICRIVLEDINRLTAAACSDPDFVERLEKIAAHDGKDRALPLQNELKKHKKRLAELDELFTSVYEDKALGRVSSRYFDNITAKWTSEQAELEGRIEQLAGQLRQQEETKRRVQDFTATLKSYAGFRELTRPLVKLLIEDITVHETDEDADGNRRQTVEIHYKNIGVLEDIVFEPVKIVWNYSPIACRECGKVFTPKGARAQFCPACAKARQKAKSYESKKRKREEYRRVVKQGYVYEKKVCPVCGGEFRPMQSGRQTYCGAECRQAARRRSAAQKRQAAELLNDAG